MKRTLLFLLLTAGVIVGVELNATKVTNSGILIQTGATQNPVAAMTVLHQINVVKADQTESVTENTAYTLSGTPATGITFGMTLTANSSGPYTCTLPGGTWEAELNGTTITTFTIPASATLHLSVYYDGSVYWLSGEPEAITDGDLSLSGKPPPLLVFTTNQTLSGEKSQTANGVTTTSSTSDVLTTGQTTASENGFWKTGAGAWTRPVYYSHGSATQCTTKVCASAPTRSGTYAGTTWRTVNTSAVTIDTTATTWTLSALNLTDPGNTAGVLPSAGGGTGQASYSDGQLVIGNSATGGLSKAAITAGANVTVTNGNGTITIASTGGATTGNNNALFTATANGANDHVASDTSLVGTGVGSSTTPANYFAAGTSLNIEASGYYSTPLTLDTLNVKLKAGSTSVGSTGAVTLLASMTNQAWRMYGFVTCRTAGASGTFIVNTIFETTGSALTPAEAKIVNTSTVTLDTTGTLVWDLTAVWGGTTAGEIITGTNFQMFTPGTGLQDPGSNGIMKRTALDVTSAANATDIGGILYCVDAGSNDTYVATPAPALASYANGVPVFVKLNTANTGAATLNLNGLGAKTIKKTAGGITTDLADNDIRAGSVHLFTYDGTNFQILSSLGNAVGAGAGTVTATGGSLTSNAVVLGAGTTDTKVVTGVTTDGTSAINLGVAGTSVGKVVLANATSGTITLSPPTGALGTVTVTVPASTDTLVAKATVDTLTNKRVTPRVASLADAATVTPDIDTYDGGLLATLSQTTTLANPTGTPTDFQRYTVRIKSTTARTLAFGNQFRFSTDLPVPATTTGSSLTDYMAFQWNAADSKWDMVAKNFGF